ncbi:MAG: PAS domain-containing protein, partial [Saprospiraceae bacterium]|nr:PAS domain-containing protein [Saprospiraceae bacterium]
TRRQRTELAEQVELKTSSLKAATLDAQEQKSRAENLHEKLQNVLSTSSIGIWEFSYLDEKLVWDDKMYQIYGVDPKDFGGAYTDWLDRLHPDDIQRVSSVDTSRLEKDEYAAIEFRIVRPSGEIRHIYSNVYMEKDEHGKPIRTTGVTMDITERRTTELALFASEETFKQLVEEVAEVIWSTTCDGILTYLSPQFMKLVGYAPEEQVGNSCLELVHPEDKPEVIKSIELLLASPESPRTDEFRLQHRNGDYVWTTGTVRAVCDDEGRPVRMQGILRNIHDRKTAEIALAETEGKFQRIAENVPGMVYRYVIHPDGSDELTYVSPGSRNVFEIEPQEALERGISTIWERIHEEDRDWLTEEIAKSGEQLEPFLHEYRLVLPEKGLRWVQSFAQPIRTESGDLIWDGVVLDHTDRKVAELALQEAQLNVEDVDYLNAHATSTPVGDLSEVKAITKVFGEQTENLSISATKSMTGHLLGAAGAVEAILSIKSMQEGTIPPTINVSELDPAIPAGFHIVTEKAIDKDIDVAMSNTFGFGGHNAIVIFRKM